MGFFDSGIGGLTVAKAFTEKYPNMDMLYLGDAGRVPYGKKSFEQLAEFTLEAAAWFEERGASALVLACNTVSARPLAIIENELKTRFPDMPVVGIIQPTVGYIAAEGFERVAILSTESTKASGTYVASLAARQPSLEVLHIGCPGWESLVEAEEIGTPGALELIRATLKPHIDQFKMADAIVLACTHYPFLIPELAEVLPGKRFITQGDCVLAEIERTHSDIIRNEHGVIEAFTTGNTESASRTTSKYLGAEIWVKETKLGSNSLGSPISLG